MRILLTGASGFIGSHVAERLLGGGHAVAALLRPSTDAWRLRAVLPQLVRINGDLHDLAAVTAAVGAFRPDAVVHTAWQGVAGAERNAEEQQEANVPPTLELVRLAARVGAGTFVGLGSQAEYGPQNCRLREDAPPRATTAYGRAKLRAGQEAARLAAETGLRFAWLRVFSTYGPRDNAAWMIPSLIRALLRRERPALTAGTQLWDYLYVTDAAEAITRVVETQAAAGVYNLGSGQAVPLRAVVERIRDLVDPALPLGFGEVPFRPDQVMHLEADIERLEATTGWRPEVNLEDGLRMTVEEARRGGSTAPGAAKDTPG